jgi:hypothetical protein
MNFHLESNMSEKSVIISPPVPKHVCPICGKAAYSLGGIHPQCAIVQADAKRMVKVRAERAAEPKVKKPVRQSWQKKCPQCERQSHVRSKKCACGHEFA